MYIIIIIITNLTGHKTQGYLLLLIGSVASLLLGSPLINFFFGEKCNSEVLFN